MRSTSNPRAFTASKIPDNSSRARALTWTRSRRWYKTSSSAPLCARRSPRLVARRAVGHDSGAPSYRRATRNGAAAGGCGRFWHYARKVKRWKRRNRLQTRSPRVRRWSRSSLLSVQFPVRILILPTPSRMRARAGCAGAMFPGYIMTQAVCAMLGV